MPFLISRATGNFTSSSTWGVAEAGTSAQQTAATASTSSTTSYVYSSTFTGTNTVVCDGVALFLKRTSTTGTFSVGLSANSGSTNATTVTVNTSDLPADESWVFFKFGSTVTFNGGSTYCIGITSSSSSTVTVYRNATAGNWCRLPGTTATAAPGAGDQLLIVGERTGAGAGNSFTVTMDNTATTQFGTASTQTPTQTTNTTSGIEIGQNGTLEWGTSASTNYLLNLAGNLSVWSGGTYRQGTSGTPVPTTSTAVLNIVMASTGQFGVYAFNGSTFTTYGQPRTSGKNVYYTLLTADAAANATTLTVADDTGWLSGDRIGVASTTRTNTQTEINGTLSANAGASSLSVASFSGTGGGVLNAHSGTSPAQAEVVNFSRNVRIYGTSTSFNTFVYVNTTSAFSSTWTEYRYIGNNSSTKLGIQLLTTTGSATLRYCTVCDIPNTGSVIGVQITGATANNITVDSCIVSGSGFNQTAGISVASATTGTNIQITNNIVLYGATGIALLDVGITLTGNRIVSSLNGLTLGENATVGTMNSNVMHSTIGSGIVVNTTFTGVFGSATIWRTSSYGLTANSVVFRLGTEFSGLTFFGCGTGSILFGPGNDTSDATFTSITSNGDSTFSTATGFVYGGSSVGGGKITFRNCDFSTVSGIKTAHTTDISLPSSTIVLDMDINYTKLGAATQISNLTLISPSSKVMSSAHNRVAGAFNTYKKYGVISRDTTIFNTAAPSERLTPNDASNKLVGASRFVSVDSGATKTISVYVRKSAAGDGAAYTGNQPRLVLRRADNLGITSDTVLATYASGTGSWNQISGTTAAATSDGAFEVYVDCDGTAGWVNVDDFAVT